MKSNIDSIAEMLQQLSPAQLQQVSLRTANRDGSKIRAKRIARTEKYFRHAPKPHQCLTFGVYKDTVDYMAEIGTEAWLAQKVNNRTKNAMFVTVRKQ